MVRIYLFLLALLITLSLTTRKTFSKEDVQNSVGKPISVTIPQNIYKIIQNSCVDCHAKGGKMMAMSHVNFSDWDNYPPEKKAVKAANIVKILQKNKMPPKLYRESHPETILTSAQVESIVKWADSLPKK
jgi:hypothetical protein